MGLPDLDGLEWEDAFLYLASGGGAADAEGCCRFLDADSDRPRFDFFDR